MRLTEREREDLLGLADHPGFPALRKLVAVKVEDAVTHQGRAFFWNVWYYMGFGAGLAWMPHELDAIAARSAERGAEMTRANGADNGLIDRLKARRGGAS